LIQRIEKALFSKINQAWILIALRSFNGDDQNLHDDGAGRNNMPVIKLMLDFHERMSKITLMQEEK